jgi:hypothetical protein
VTAYAAPVLLLGAEPRVLCSPRWATWSQPRTVVKVPADLSGVRRKLARGSKIGALIPLRGIEAAHLGQPVAVVDLRVELAEGC